MNEPNALRISNEKQVYDIIKQLMIYADRDEKDKFISIVNENYREIFQNPRLCRIRPEIIIMSGLIARNKTELLKYFVEKLDAEKYCIAQYELLSQLIGTLIFEKKDAEALSFFLEKKIGFFRGSALEYIFTAIIATDNIELFRTVYNICKDVNVYLNEPFRINFFSLPVMAVLEGAIFGSKKILDLVTDNGSAFRNCTLPENISFFIIQELSYANGVFYSQYNGKCLPEVCWLEKLYSMYFKNEPPEEAYARLTDIAEEVNIFKRNFNYLIDENIYENKLLRLEIARICGTKTNDLSFIARYIPGYPSDCVDPQYIIGLLRDVAGSDPYVDFFVESEFGIKLADNIILFARFADMLPTAITVRLICGFDDGIINLLRGTNVRFELDISDRRTSEYLRKFFDKPLGVQIPANDPVFSLMTALIEEKLITVKTLIKLVDTAKCPDIVNFLFNYDKNRK